MTLKHFLETLVRHHEVTFPEKVTVWGSDDDLREAVRVQLEAAFLPDLEIAYAYQTSSIRHKQSQDTWWLVLDRGLLEVRIGPVQQPTTPVVTRMHPYRAMLDVALEVQYMGGQSGRARQASPKRAVCRARLQNETLVIDGENVGAPGVIRFFRELEARRGSQ
jgi:hypothetical protein